MGLRDIAAALGPAQERSLSLSWQMLDTLRYGGHQYLLNPATTYGPNEPPVQLGERSAYSSNGVAFSVVRRRVDLFKQARFAFKRYGAGPRPMAADLFTSEALRPLDNPAPLLAWMEVDAATAGNAYVVRDGARLRRLNPEWCTIVMGSQREPDDPQIAWDAEPVGLIHRAPTVGADKAEVFMWPEVAHYAPVEDPDARFRGMSYLRPALDEVSNTNAYNRYIRKYWENNATANMAVVFPPEVQEQTVKAFSDLFLEGHRGVDRAFKTAFLGGGADLKMIGANLKDLAAKEITSDQFAKICAAAGVPPIVVTIVPGLESASTYANYQTAMRSFADFTVRPLWLEAVSALGKLVPAPSGAELWYDVSGVSAMQADALDDAEVQAKQAQTMRTLVDGGFEPSSVLLAVTTGDLTKLVHTGNLSVQLIPGGQAPAQGGGSGG